MICTLDAISGGRIELGLGAGWKRDEWRAYGYGFPDAPERLAILKDQLEIARAMMTTTTPPTRASITASRRHQRPQPVQQPRIPIMVGGNGPNVTWRLAARYADELNLDGLTPGEVRQALPIIQARCAEIGRDPATLASRSTSGGRRSRRRAQHASIWSPPIASWVSRALSA